MKRVYGNTNTHLHLSRKAEEFYRGADMFIVYEYESEDADGNRVYTYTISAWGDPESQLMTEEQINSILEFYADIMEDDEFEEWEELEV